MSSVKKPEVAAVNVDDLYSRYLKESIIHRREIVQYEVDGNKYLLTYAQKKGEWYYSDCILIVTLNLQGRLMFGFSRTTTGFPIHQKVLPVFKRSIPIEQIKDVKINKEKELHILIQGFGDQSLWKFRFFSSGMVQKWSDLLIKLRFHNAQKQANSVFFSAKGASKIEEVKVAAEPIKGQVVVQKSEVKVNKQAAKQEVGHQHLKVNKQQVKVEENKLNLALSSETLYKSKIAELQKERDHLKSQLAVKNIQPHSLPPNALENQTLFKSKINELQKEKSDILLQTQVKSKQKEKVVLELQQQSKVDKSTIAQLTKTKAQLLIEVQNKNKEKQQVLSEVVLQNSTLKSKLAESTKSKLQDQAKFSNLKKQSQAALAVLSHEKALLVQKNNQILKLKEEVKSQLQMTQKLHQKNFLKLSQENKICKEKIVETQKTKEAMASQLTSKITEHEQSVIDFNQKQKASEQKYAQLLRLKDQTLQELENIRGEHRSKLNLLNLSSQENKQLRQQIGSLQKTKEQLSLQVQAKHRQNVKIYSQLTQQNNRCKDRIEQLTSRSDKLEGQLKEYTISSQQKIKQHQEDYQNLLRAKLDVQTQFGEKIRKNQDVINRISDQNNDIKRKIAEREQFINNLKAQHQITQKQYQNRISLISNELKQNKIRVEELLKTEESAKIQLQRRSEQYERTIAELTAQSGTFKQKSSTLQNQILRLKEQHVVKLKQKDSIVLQLNSKIGGFKETIQHLEYNRADMLLTIQNKQKSLVMMEQSLSQLAAQKNKIEQERKQQQIVNKELILKKQAQIGVIKAKFEELSAKMLKKDQEIGSKNKELQKYIVSIKQLKKQIALKETQIEKHKNTCEQIRTNFTAKNGELQRRNQDIENRLNSANKLAQNLSQSIKLQEQKSVMAAQTIRNKDFQNEKLKLSLEGVQNKLQVAQTQIAFLQVQLQESKANSLSQLIKINTESNESEQRVQSLPFMQPLENVIAS